MRDKRLGVLFVCTGNICRSPTAEAVFRKLVADAGMSEAILTDSAGTHGYHVGEPPDDRTQRHAKQRGYDLSAQRARHLSQRDFEEFDLVLAMDRGHLRILQRLCPPQHAGKVRLLLQEADVPDPYYGGPEGFEQVLDLVEAACRSLLTEIR